MSAEGLWRPSGVQEQRLLGTRGRDHPHEALRTPGTAQHFYPCVCVRRLDQEGHGDGLATDPDDQSHARRNFFSEVY